MSPSSSLDALRARHEDVVADGLDLNLTRGKPSAEQLDLSNRMATILGQDLHDASGTDLRNYGGRVAGIDEFGARLLDVPAANVLAGGNASLELMWHAMMLHALLGVDGPASAWRQRDAAKVLCPVPGYDRHFTLTERLGLTMVPVPLRDDGPDMDVVEHHVRTDPDVVAMWNVPKHQNPTGITYSDEVVDRIAALGSSAGPHFRVLWDNAYAVHDLAQPGVELPSLWEAAAAHGTLDSVLLFASTSKITWAGSGVSFVGASDANLAALGHHLGAVTIGPDKPNHARHLRLLPDEAALLAHMALHAQVLGPRFEVVLDSLARDLGTDGALGRWTEPVGGYFVSFWSQPGCASRIVELAAQAGVALTPAGAAFPYGVDPDDSHIRIAPSFPSVSDLRRAMDVFTLCVRLAAAETT